MYPVDIQFERSRIITILIWMSGAAEPTVIPVGNCSARPGISQRPRSVGIFVWPASAESPPTAAPVTASRQLDLKESEWCEAEIIRC